MIARSADLQRRYAAEYVFMLRAVRDRDLAKDAARVNVSALLFGEPRIVPLEGRVNGRQLRIALGRGGEDLAADTWDLRDEWRSRHRPHNV